MADEGNESSGNASEESTAEVITAKASAAVTEIAAVAATSPLRFAGALVAFFFAAGFASWIARRIRARGKVGDPGKASAEAKPFVSSRALNDGIMEGGWPQ